MKPAQKRGNNAFSIQVAEHLCNRNLSLGPLIPFVVNHKVRHTSMKHGPYLFFDFFGLVYTIDSGTVKTKVKRAAVDIKVLLYLLAARLHCMLK